MSLFALNAKPNILKFTSLEESKTHTTTTTTTTTQNKTKQKQNHPVCAVFSLQNRGSTGTLSSYKKDDKQCRWTVCFHVA